MSELLGHLVEIIGNADEGTAHLNGKQGMVVQSSERHGQYIVETFDCAKLDLPSHNLKKYTPTSPEEGGFNVLWPRSSEGAADAEGAADFSAQVAQTLRDQDYCVMQMYMPDDYCEQALAEAAGPKFKYKRMKKEFESAYLGREHKCKAAWMESIADTSEELMTALDFSDGYMSNFTELLAPLAPHALDFAPYSRTSAMLRLPLAGTKDEKSMAVGEELTEEDIEDGLVDNHIQFLKRRQICLLFTLATEGGTLTLIPKGSDKQNITLPLVKRRMVAFRTTNMTYIYRASGTTDLTLQAWLLSEPDQLEYKCIEGDVISKDEAVGLFKGPNTPVGKRTNVIGMACGFNGGADMGQESWWAAVSIGTDGVCKVPFARFDMDIYSRKEDQWTPGLSYTVHGGFVVEDIYALDNKFFGIDEGDAWIMAPGQKHFLEKGYEALYKAGLRRENLKGRKIGIFVGHSGDDWTCSTTFTVGGHDVCKKGNEARQWSVLASRIAFVFGIKGPQTLIDTACSSSLCAYGIGHTMMRNPETDQPNVGISNRLEEALMGGTNMMPGPGGHIGCCGPHMLSIMGRCFTFDQSADGYCRGEGTGGIFVRNEDKPSEQSWATVIGSCLNQDGRSASMTAPNGPAQQQCILGSMSEAGLSANQVTQAELHGTGTALGDPIEVGALRGVMQDREVPLMQASAKSHIAHLEACAGQAGIQKCILMCSACAGTPNCHLLTLNPHLDVNGYPTTFNTELADYGSNSGYSGVSSFGFGGANSRADVYASATKGPRKTGVLNLDKIDYVTVTCPFDEGPMHYLDGKAVPLATSKEYRQGRYHADAIREEFATYDHSSYTFTGQYQRDPQEVEHDDVPDEPIYIIGSWDNFRAPLPMERLDKNTHTGVIPLGETRCEQFQLRVDKDQYRAIYPVAKNGSMRTRVIGPHHEGDGFYWLLDGRDDEVPAGTEYQITLRWGVVPSLTWEQTEVAEKSKGPDKDFISKWGLTKLPKTLVSQKRSGVKVARHQYSIMGSWTAWQIIDMNDISKREDEENMWEAIVKIGIAEFERFRFIRDHDMDQQIYPAKSDGDDTVPVRGPDHLCNNKSWKITGKAGEVVKIRLQLVDAHIILTTVSKKTNVTVSYESVEGPKRHSYHISGTINNWGYDEMMLDEKKPGVFTCQCTVGESCQEIFKIVVDEDADLALTPEDLYGVPGTSIARGPGRPPNSPEGAYWSITSLRPGAIFEISVNRVAVDKRKVVDIRWVTDPVDFDSMRETVYNAIVYPQYSQ